MRRRIWSVAWLSLALAGGALAAGAPEWLSLCGKCLSPSVTSKSGIGTANAVAEGKITRRDAEAWCANWSPGDKGCVRRELSSDDAKRSYRASADCTAGRITAIDGVAYTLAGVWTGDVGKGRTRWRDPAGKIVGQDNASNGLAIAQQWELLCPGVTQVRAPGAPQAPKTAAPQAPAAQFTVGQTIEAKFGRDWVRGQVTRVRQGQSANGPQLEYDVTLENGQRGVVPARMLRAPQGR